MASWCEYVEADGQDERCSRSLAITDVFVASSIAAPKRRTRNRKDVHISGAYRTKPICGLRIAAAFHEHLVRLSAAAKPLYADRRRKWEMKW